MIQCPVFYMEHEVLVTGFWLRVQVEATHLGPIEIATLCLCLLGPIA
jgi:hypothetical protein